MPRSISTSSLSWGRAAFRPCLHRSTWLLKAAAIIVFSLFTTRGASAFLTRHTSSAVGTYGGHLAISPRRTTAIRMASSNSGDSSTLLSHLGYLRQNARLVLASKSPRRVEVRREQRRAYAYMYVLPLHSRLSGGVCSLVFFPTIKMLGVLADFRAAWFYDWRLVLRGDSFHLR